ncbi:sulfatase-like hydrolase/transferase [Aurantiacibacter spongiae]|uniref:Sulfatase N-terminal domain-containing protein n=1 Tax=Aurantiacibacter spongiae TaxID=2488860 RepID=A0A3N5CXU6_9SPHN|nr:sulfatase-like hydrolase/transferase [Aurantiacibacter spongiae]RPF71469.1 hypothetical protein EG799_07450 [Aurantiacibacter spongiae]
MAIWLLVWVVLANLVFATMWLLGAPPRSGEIVAGAAIGLLVRKSSYWVKAAAFIVVMAYSVASFTSGLFNLAVSSLLHSVRFFLELNPSESTEYLSGAVFLACTIGLALKLLRKDTTFHDTRLVLFVILVSLSLGAVDHWIGQGMRGHYNRIANSDAQFSSASGASGFAHPTGGKKPHLMLIMVESLGEPMGNPEMSRLLFARFKSPAIRKRFDLTLGDTTYFNSTTAGEIRELCGRWGDYYDVLDAKDESCLPARLAVQGYDTRAYHSFTGNFFDRRTWYPNIGFQHQEFSDELRERGARECGGVFPGVCDRDIPAILAKDLKAAKNPQFVYWLTVNSHLPVPPGMNLDVDHCEDISLGLARDFPMICRQFALWDQLEKALVEEITASDFPETDILVVGDHMPPYFGYRQRSQFAPDRVPFLFLKWKHDNKVGIPVEIASHSPTRTGRSPG